MYSPALDSFCVIFFCFVFVVVFVFFFFVCSSLDKIQPDYVILIKNKINNIG